MATVLQTVIDGRARRLDARDVAAWWGSAGAPDPDDPEWRSRADAYVEAHPRPPGAGHARAQRVALLRRLAAGPATRSELLAALRTVGWVGADDLENRLRELRPGARRGTPGGPAIVEGADALRLAEPFALLDGSAERSLAFTKAILGRLDSPLSQQALATLDGLCPGLDGSPRTSLPGGYRATAAMLERLEGARAGRRPVRVRYFSLNSGLERTYELVCVRYVTVGPVVKALCVPVDPEGRRADRDRQFALDRVRAVEPLPEWADPTPEATRLAQSAIELDVSEGLYRVMVERGLLGIAADDAEQLDTDAYRVRGSFPVALAWDVMEQLCAWAGTAQVREPRWLVNAVCRRLRKGLEVMESAGPFALVKPDPDQTFDDHGEAVHWEPHPAPDPSAPGSAGRARRLSPRGDPAR